MNLTPYWHLAWKEYRAIRAFWLALVGLVALAEWLSITINHSTSAVTWVFNLALGAPAFFAIGAAGMAFAIEREEGTLDFLRAAPVSAKQVLVAKLAMATFATLAMYLLLWPMAILFTGGRLPESTMLGGMLGLWIVAAFEAIAWGTLFSLLSARPSLAICQGIFAVSTIAHLLTWKIMGRSWTSSAYLTVAPWRILIALVVLAADIYLGLRWLHRDSGSARIALPFPRSGPIETTIPAATGGTANAAIAAAKKLLVNSDRSTMLGHLFWQHWRQSAWLMLALASMWIAVAFAIGLQFQFNWSGEADHILMDTVIVGAALLGCCVFRADQDRRYYRFFVEHNVPPRYVWFTRQLPWLATFLIATLIICMMCARPANLEQLWQFLSLHLGEESQQITREHLFDLYGLRAVGWPVLGMIMAFTVVSYSAGQWASMMIRSGLIAAVVGVLLSMVLCSWVWLMDVMRVDWLWSVAPLPIMLVGATWLRAPDWIAENRRWSARARAAAILLLPATALLIAVPIYRVRQVPLVTPGFDADKGFPPITAEAQATDDLYRRANELYVPTLISPGPSENTLSFSAPLGQPLTETGRQWLRENAKPLALVLEASLRPTCEFFDPGSATERGILRNGDDLVRLVIASGRQFEEEGKLDEALDRYFLALRVDGELVATTWALPEVDYIFSQIADWAAQRNQTTERIDAALERLGSMDASILRLDENLKLSYVIARRRVLEGAGAIYDSDQTNASSLEAEIIWLRLMPWERQRALRMLNLLTSSALDRVRIVRQRLADRKGVVGYIDPWTAQYRDFAKFFDPMFDEYRPEELQKPDDEGDWLQTTHPSDLWQIGYVGFSAVAELAEFETWRRAAMIRLALESYRLEHGALPHSLAALVGPYFREVPRDPYSGLEFGYFPAGLPQAAISPVDEKAGFHRIAPDVPFIWSTGPNLVLNRERPPDKDEPAAIGLSINPYESLKYHMRSYRGEWAYQWTVADAAMWAKGFWFPIPEQRH